MHVPMHVVNVKIPRNSSSRQYQLEKKNKFYKLATIIGTRNWQLNLLVPILLKSVKQVRLVSVWKAVGHTDASLTNFCLMFASWPSPGKWKRSLSEYLDLNDVLFVGDVVTVTVCGCACMFCVLPSQCVSVCLSVSSYNRQRSLRCII